MTDKELLEYAAKAAGVKWVDETFPYEEFGRMMVDFGNGNFEWNPLIDDGDAFRLLVKLQLFEEADMDIYYDRVGNDLYAATRLAIVRAAAEIGKDMK